MSDKKYEPGCFGVIVLSLSVVFACLLAGLILTGLGMRIERLEEKAGIKAGPFAPSEVWGEMWAEKESEP